MSYKHLTLEERYHIQAYKEAGYKQNEIANKIGANPSTISRELQKNSTKIHKRYKTEKYHYGIYFGRLVAGTDISQVKTDKEY